MKKVLKTLLLILICTGIVGCGDKKTDNTSLSPKEVYEFLKEEGYTFKKEPGSTGSTMYTYFYDDDIWIQYIDNIYVGEMVTFKNEKLNDEHASIINQEENDTKELKEQYDGYLDWLKELGLEKAQVIDVLEYYDDNN